MKFSFTSILILGFLIGCTIFRVEAQEAQSEAVKSRILMREQMEIQLQQMETSIGDSDGDLGEQILVRRKPKPWTITLSSDVGEIFSSNVTLVNEDHISDFALTHNDAFNGTYKFTDELSLSAWYRYSIYRYNRLILQNFDAHNAGGSLSYALPENFSLNTGVQWTTIYSSPVGDSVYEEADWSIGASKVVPLNFAPWVKDKAAWFAGYQTDVRIASPKDYDKVEVSPYTGLSYQILPKLTAQAFYRWQYQHFQRDGRKDYNNSISGSIAWAPYDWLSWSAFVGSTWNNSVGTTRDYQVLNLGTSVRFSWKF